MLQDSSPQQGKCVTTDYEWRGGQEGRHEPFGHGPQGDVEDARVGILSLKLQASRANRYPEQTGTQYTAELGNGFVSLELIVIKDITILWFAHSI